MNFTRGQGLTLGALVLVAAGVTTVLTAFEKVGLDVPRPVWIDELDELREAYNRTNKWNTRTLIDLIDNDIALIDKRIAQAEAAGDQPPLDLIRRRVALENRKMWLERRLDDAS